ncbi:UNVERIFIED_CONTAM: Peptide chain release factor PrfB3, chloroplastic [Sesamum radiatum]|uniref:Peptide chain release factor PrfB3, chloroplastic n=1 Tax=Sesamum radiatum TaxID=300843 RepID=A0AAW2N7F3_SESRA
MPYMKMAAESLRPGFFNEAQFKNRGSFLSYYPKMRASASFNSRASRASQEPLDDDKNKFYKELGMFSLRKRIEDSILRAQMLAPTALELEEAKHVNQEEVVRDYDLWDDLSKSNEILIKLADSAKVVDTLRDLKYKAEEAKLITELAEMDAINYALFKQAYSASLDVNKFLDKYEMSKLLKGPYDMEGACITLESRHGDIYSEATLASVDVVPLFIESSPDLSIDDEDILVSYPSHCEDNPCRTSPAVHVQHIPTGLEVRSTGK